MDEQYMQRCLDLAGLGMGRVAPNPMVGSVIVHNDVIIGEGYHRKYGEAHAEVNAVNAVVRQELLKESTLYVNLEPCAHFGKTPPCSQLIIDKGIPKVVIGTIDPFSRVAGKGIEMLKKAGIDVQLGILEEESRKLNRRFFTFHQQSRPYIILKWAQTKDGFLDKLRSFGSEETAEWITNKTSKALVHKWRADEAAIMVGTITAIKDNPQLNIREWSGSDPLRVVLDRELKLKPDLYLLDGSIPTLVLTEISGSASNKIEHFKTEFDSNLLNKLMTELFNRDVQSVIIEGGEVLLNSFIEEGLWDEARVFTGDRYFGKGVDAPVITGNIASDEFIGNSGLIVYMR
jgi:diaminohydroxyphosphoribosylaminopyrimidine deaminase / 5-amino-6-(5-phosphoribosylamino)uracil reductase